MKQKTIEIKYNFRKEMDENDQNIEKFDVEKYTLQHPGIGWYLDTVSSATTPSGIPHQGMLYRAYLEHVVVNPKKTIEDFDTMEDGFSHLQKLMSECDRFLTS